MASRVFAVIGGVSRARLSPLCRPLIPASSVEFMMDNVFFRECQNSIVFFLRGLCFMEVVVLLTWSRCPWYIRPQGDSLDPPPPPTPGGN